MDAKTIGRLVMSTGRLQSSRVSSHKLESQVPHPSYHSPDFGVNLAGGVKLITSFSPLLSPSRSWPALRPQIMKVSKLCHGHHLTPISIGFPEPVIFFFQASVGI